jgi:hypothetical protein
MSTAKQTLSSEERDQLEAWEPPWYAIPVHAELEYQLERGLDGKENTVVLGPRGVGKSSSVRNIIRRLEALELERVQGRMKKEVAGARLSPSEAKLPPYPRRILYYQACEASGSKTAVSDLLLKLGRHVRPSEARSWSPTDIAERAYEEIKRNQVHLVCVDEAQHISANNLEHLRQVQDAARDDKYRFGLVLIGDYRLRESLRMTGQLGQRFTGLVEFQGFDEYVHSLENWHPHLTQLKKQLAPAQWQRLNKQILTAANGKFRRLIAILENANSLALKLDSRVNERVLELAIRKLAPEG